MDYVYIVYTEEGLQGCFRSEAGATQRVLELAINQMDIDTADTPLDFNSPWRWGWDICYYRKELVYA